MSIAFSLVTSALVIACCVMSWRTYRAHIKNLRVLSTAYIALSDAKAHLYCLNGRYVSNLEPRARLSLICKGHGDRVERKIDADYSLKIIQEALQQIRDTRP